MQRTYRGRSATRWQDSWHAGMNVHDSWLVRQAPCLPLPLGTLHLLCCHDVSTHGTYVLDAATFENLYHDMINVRRAHPSRASFAARRGSRWRKGRGGSAKHRAELLQVKAASRLQPKSAVKAAGQGEARPAARASPLPCHPLVSKLLLDSRAQPHPPARKQPGKLNWSLGGAAWSAGRRLARCGRCIRAAARCCGLSLLLPRALQQQRLLAFRQLLPPHSRQRLRPGRQANHCRRCRRL